MNFRLLFGSGYIIERVQHRYITHPEALVAGKKLSLRELLHLQQALGYGKSYYILKDYPASAVRTLSAIGVVGRLMSCERVQSSL